MQVQRKFVSAFDIQTCPECGSKDLNFDRELGELTCRACATVIDEQMVDLGAEYRSFEDEDGEGIQRAGIKSDPRTARTTTAIGNVSDLVKLPTKTRATIARLKKRQCWATTSYEQNVESAVNYMRFVAAKLGIPERVEKEAALIYKSAALKGLAMKRSIENLAIAALLLACKRQGVPRNMKEFAEAAKCSVSMLGKCCKLILSALGLRPVLINPIDYIQKYANELQLKPRTAARAISIYKKLAAAGKTSGLNPLSVAACALYIACVLEKEKKTQSDIAEAVRITETTLRNRTKAACVQLKIKLNGLNGKV